MRPKLIVAKDGFNALTETNPDNLRFSSDYNTLKYYASGNYTMNVAVSTNVAIPHGLGYVPFHIVYVNDFGFNPTYYALCEYFNTLGRFRAARAYADENNLYLSLVLGAGPLVTVNWYYKLFRNRLDL